MPLGAEISFSQRTLPVFQVEAIRPDRIVSLTRIAVQLEVNADRRSADVWLWREALIHIILFAVDGDGDELGFAILSRVLEGSVVPGVGSRPSAGNASAAPLAVIAIPDPPDFASERALGRELVPFPAYCLVGSELQPL